MGLACVLLLSTGLLARNHSGTITGTVKTESGVAVPHAKVTATSSIGRVVASVLTDEHGQFRFPPFQPGKYQVEVELRGQLRTGTRTVVVKEGGHDVLNFVSKPARAAPAGKSDVLGPVSFYNHPEFKQGELKDPSGGGGYSNAASAQAIKILNQYLVPEEPPAAGSDAGGNKKSSSSDEVALGRSGRMLLAQKHYAQAAKVFEKATARYPRSERLQMGLGLAFFGAGKYPEAMGALQQAARLAPGDSAPMVMLAETLQFVQDPAAGRLLERFSKLHPENARGHYAYGLSLWRDFRMRPNPEKLAGAREQFERAIALDHADADAHLHLGMVYDEQKAPARAVAEYLAAIRVNPKLASAHYHLAQDYEHLGEKRKAAEEFAQYEKLRGYTSH